MFKKALVMYVYAETPIHPGSGATISGVVDLPVQRERHTEFPIIQGSSIKGVLRNSACMIRIDDKCKQCDKPENVEKSCEILDQKILDQIFGSPEGIGGISVTDARILAFPVRALKGVFGWITCPLVLDRYQRDLALAGKKVDWKIPKLSETEVIVSPDSNLIATNKYVYIEDLELTVKKDKENMEKITEDMVDALPNDVCYKEIKEKLKKDLVVVSDVVFRDLVSLTTEVVTRIKITPETGTVKDGLWSEEYLPTDSLMYSLILIPIRLNTQKANDVERKVMKYDGKILQIGGDETIGKGFVRIKIKTIEGGKNVKES